MADEARELGAEFIRRMRGIGITVEVFHTELGLGAVEFAMAPAGAMEAADYAIRAKTYCRELCAEKGLTASFMAKWRVGDSGCGAHVHQSVWKTAGTSSTTRRLTGFPSLATAIWPGCWRAFRTGA